MLVSITKTLFNYPKGTGDVLDRIIKGKLLRVWEENAKVGIYLYDHKTFQINTEGVTHVFSMLNTDYSYLADTIKRYGATLEKGEELEEPLVDVINGCNGMYVESIESGTEKSIGDGCEALELLEEYGLDYFELAADYLNYTMNDGEETMEAYFPEEGSYD